jgi:alpha-1,2-mannosyltransferase
MSALLITACLVVIPFTLLLSLASLRITLRLIGWSLLHKSSNRKNAITARAQADEDVYSRSASLQPPREDEDWERVEGYAASSAPNGEIPKDSEWKGVVGFFHPFW